MNDSNVDHALVDRRSLTRIGEALRETLFVEAGAGTGKTNALVERVVALVLGGRPIERIVAITFTEKAAAELRDRVRSGLEAAQAAHPEKGDLIRRALESLDRAQISTIHSFGQALLYSFAAEAGVDPAFTVQDEVIAQRRFEERWRMYLEGLAGDQAAIAAIDRVLGLGLTTGHLHTLAGEVAARAELTPMLEANQLAMEPPLWPDLDRLRREMETLPLESAREGDKLRERAESLLALVRSLALAGDEREAVLAAGAPSAHSSHKGSAGAWGGAVNRDAVLRTVEAASEALKETLDACRSEALAQVLPLIVEFVRRDAEDRGREGVLTFDDLIMRMRDLLGDDPEAAAALRERYDALLIDEFQDTDPLQVDIARSFATDPRTAKLERGRLFLVGDPKQSIYRFRRADMAIYSRIRELVEADGGEFPQLALNRRSREPILDWVNAVFQQVIGEGDLPAVQPPYHPIHPNRDRDLRGPGVAWLGGEVDANARQVRQTEARAIAARCRAAVDDGWEVEERDGTVRPASFRDIAILIPARTILSPLERALADAGIPFRVEGGSLIYRTQEVRDLTNCLAAIDNPADEVVVVGALRSAAFSCSDVELARHKAAGGRFTYLHPDLDRHEGRVADALRRLKEYHAERHKKSLAALVEGFVAGQGLVETGILDQGDRNAFRRMKFVAEQARAFEANGPENLRAFVAWLESRSGEGVLDNEGGSLDEDEDAVRVLTIHGAKGLEFPVVFMGGLGSAPGGRPPNLMVDRTGERVAVSVGWKTRNTLFKLGPVSELEALEKAHGEAEFGRLLYVAATRARDHLIVSLYHPARANQCGARRLIAAGACERAEELPPVAGAAPVGRDPLADVTIDAEGLVAPEEFDSGRERLVAESRRKRYTSATALKQQRREVQKEEKTDETEPWSRGRGGTRLGRAVHAAIQSLPLDADDEAIAAFARAQAVAEAIPAQEGEVARLVRRALESQAARRARGAARAMREVPFAVEIDGTVLEGFVDLVIESADGIEIVDWKTDRIAAGEVPARLREYEPQAALYVLGIEAAARKQVNRVTYVFVSAGVEESADDPGALRDRARAYLAEQGP